MMSEKGYNQAFNIQNLEFKIGVLVPRKGFEPQHHCWRQDLNLVRLPIPPPGREGAILTEHVTPIK